MLTIMVSLMDFLLFPRRDFSYACAWGLCAIEESRPHVDLDYCRYVRLRGLHVVLVLAWAINWVS